MRHIRPALKAMVEKEVKMMLHASRDCLRNLGKETTRIRFDANDGYYGEAMGVMRGLKLLGYGWFGSSNLDGTKDGRFPQPRPGTNGVKIAMTVQPEHNLRWWFCQIEDKVLAEENFGGSGQCLHCLKHYRKDDATEARKKSLASSNVSV